MMAIYSVTKTFTAAEVMHLAATGRVDLDAPLSKYVQHRLTGNGATVRQALGMRSGLPGFTDQESQALLSAGLAHPGRHWTMQESLAYLKGTPSPPGGDPVYSCAKYWLLGLLVENVTGRSVAEAYRADLLDPAGLNRIAVQDTERPTAPLAAPPRRLHLPPPDGYLPYRSIASGTGPAGGIATDAQTVARVGLSALRCTAATRRNRAGNDDAAITDQHLPGCAVRPGNDALRDTGRRGRLRP
jgi:D-alanyl-D-alanine carboxypeptidase